MQTSAPILLLQQTSYANDPLLSCAIMLEMLDVLMQSDRPFRHNLIFLFNGAEENLLPVSKNPTRSLVYKGWLIRDED